MALFNREPEKNVKAEPPKPVAAPVKPVAAPAFAAPPQPEKAPMPVAVSAAPPRPAVATGESAAYLDRTCRITGKLSFEASTRLDGTIDGEIIAKDHLVIGETAEINAQIRAASIVVAGKVHGDITATHRIEIRPSGRVIGNLSAPVFVVHDGALFEGHCSMQSDSAQNERKVTVFPKDERPPVKDDRAAANGVAAAAPQAGAQKSA
jgi:cytoskeletal protein CcmA (bactofilin family)